MKMTNALAAAANNALRTALNGGRLYYFSGPVPAEAGDALDMVDDHTELVEFTLDGAGVTGLTFATSTGTVLSKTGAETWSGLVDFDGKDAASPTLTPTFFRFCPAGDNGRGASAGARLQGTIGGPASTAELKLTDGTTVTDNGSNTRSLPVFNIELLLLS